MNHNSLNKADSQPMYYNLKVAQLERALLKFDMRRTFKYILDESYFLLFSRRMGKKYRLLIAITDGDHYRYEPFIDADSYLIEKFYDKLLSFFAEYTEYLEAAPEFLW